MTNHETEEMTKKQIYIINKEEAYTYDELDFISQMILKNGGKSPNGDQPHLQTNSTPNRKVHAPTANSIPTATITANSTDLVTKSAPSTNSQLLLDRIEKLKSALAQNKTSMAIFFMPKQTFDLFSLIQGQKAICQIDLADIEKMEKVFGDANQGDAPVSKFPTSVSNSDSPVSKSPTPAGKTNAPVGKSATAEAKSPAPANTFPQSLHLHLQKKLSTLAVFLKSGNAVCPVPIQADNLQILTM